MEDLKSEILKETLVATKDYLPLSRLVFAIDDLTTEKNAIPRYKKDMSSIACLIPRRGAIPVKIYEAEELIVPILQYASNPTWEVSQKNTEELDSEHLDRAKTRALRSLGSQEDSDTLRILTAVVSEDHFRICDIHPLENPEIFLNYLADGIADLKEHGVPPGHIIFPQRLFEYLSLVEHKHLYIVKNNISEDIAGTILGGYYKDIPIIVNPNVSCDRIFITGKPALTGVFVIKCDITSSGIIDYPQKLRHGAVFSEEIGLACVNDYAVSSTCFAAMTTNKSILKVNSTDTKKQPKTLWEKLSRR